MTNFFKFIFFALFISQCTYANDWQTYSLDTGNNSFGLSVDTFNDFAPIFFGFGIRNFHSNGTSEPDNSLDAHLGVGVYNFYGIIGVAAVKYNNSGDVKIFTPVTISSGFSLDKAKHFIISPYVTTWKFDNEWETDVGLRFSYSPQGVQPSRP